MKEYEINEETLAIIPVDKEKSLIYEKNDEFYIYNDAYRIIDNSCSYFGSSLLGRQIGSKKILGSGYKIPIIVEDSKEIIFFPTTSPNSIDCSWISLNNIKKLLKEENKTAIIFDNDQKIIIDVPYLSVQNQILRSSRLSTILKKRKNQ